MDVHRARWRFILWSYAILSIVLAIFLVIVVAAYVCSHN
jgi:hypothetical protein